MEQLTHDVWFVYDGECPICLMGASLYKVRQAVGALHTVDARTEHEHPLLQEVYEAGLNLDDGMVIKYKDSLYQGDEALHIMAQLGDKRGFFNHINNSLFQSKRMATLCYPSMRAARNIALKLKGASQINNLKR